MLLLSFGLVDAPLNSNFALWITSGELTPSNLLIRDWYGAIFSNAPGIRFISCSEKLPSSKTCLSSAIRRVVQNLIARLSWLSASNFSRLSFTAALFIFVPMCVNKLFIAVACNLARPSVPIPMPNGFIWFVRFSFGIYIAKSNISVISSVLKLIFCSASFGSI